MKVTKQHTQLSNMMNKSNSKFEEDSPNVHNDEEQRPNQSITKDKIITVSRVS